MSVAHQSKRTNLRAIRRRMAWLEGKIAKALAEGDGALPFFREEHNALEWATKMLDRDYGPGNAAQVVGVLERAQAEARWDGRSTIVAREILAEESISWDEFARGVASALSVLQQDRGRRVV